MAAFLEEDSKAGKSAAIAQGLINTYQAVTTALKAYPPPFSYIAASGQLIFGLKQVAAIRKIETPKASKGTSRVGATTTGGTTSSPSISAPTIPEISAPEITADISPVDTGMQVAESISQERQTPTRAYVVESDISSKQALNRRTNKAASF